MSSDSIRMAYFISPHGYGHAARSAAIMTALRDLDSKIQFEIFTLVPDWFFENSLGSEAFHYHTLLTDIGLAQKNSLEEDVPETLRRLDEFLPFSPDLIEKLVRQLDSLSCQLVLCDISPLGIAVAHAAGLPSILIENFTWDWIYQGYLSEMPALEPYIHYLEQIFSKATYHIQAEPVCIPKPESSNLLTDPISRKIKQDSQTTRQALRVPDSAPLVMISMGGTPWHYTFLEQLAEQTDYYFVIPSNQTTEINIQDHLILLPANSRFFHPDLVNASQALISKVGYSTLAELYQAGVPIGYLTRPQFPESEKLVDYIQNHMSGIQIPTPYFQDERWLSLLPDLLALPRKTEGRTNGADQAAQFIYPLLQP